MLNAQRHVQSTVRTKVTCLGTLGEEAPSSVQSTTAMQAFLCMTVAATHTKSTAHKEKSWTASELSLIHI